MKTKANKLLCALLAIVMVLSMLPVTALADDRVSHTFTTQPAGGSFDPDTLRYYIHWVTDFVPVRYEVWQKVSGYSPVRRANITASSQLTADAGYWALAENGNEDYYIRVFYGSGDGDYIQSQYVSVDDSNLMFTSEPAGNLSINPGTLRYNLTWSLNFVPERIIIDKGIMGEQVAEITPQGKTGGYSLPASADRTTFYHIRAYYAWDNIQGSNTNYVISNSIRLNTDTLTFTTEPRDSISLNPGTRRYEVNWALSFPAKRVVIEKLKSDGFSIDETVAEFTDQSYTGSYSFPEDTSTSNQYDLKAYYETDSALGGYISKRFSLSDEPMKFTLQPTGGDVAPGEILTTRWDTNFSPIKVQIIQKGRNSNDTNTYVVVDTLPGNQQLFTFTYNQLKTPQYPITSVEGFLVWAYYMEGSYTYVSSSMIPYNLLLPPDITTPANCLPDGKIGSSYSYRLEATGDAPITWSVVNYGTGLPPGLSMSSNGQISGVPLSNGSYTFKAKATNDYGSDELVATITVSGTPDVTSGSCGINGDNVTWSFSEASGILTISGSGQMANYSSSTLPWRYLKNLITAVIVNEGVTNVGNNAFYEFPNLALVRLPSTLTRIGDYAFSKCPALADAYIAMTKAEFNSNVSWYRTTNLSLDNAEKHFNGIASGQAGPSLYWILREDGELSFTGSGAMYNWSSPSEVPWYSYRNQILSISLDNVSSVGNYAFSGCKNLESIVLKAQTTSLGHHAFSGCSSLTSVAFAFLNMSISDYCFSGCTALESINIPVYTTGIGNHAFDGCHALTTVNFSANSTLTSVGNYAFYNCYNLKNINLPSGVTSLGDYAFYLCSSLTQFPMPSGLQSIGGYCFARCTGVTGTVTIPSGVTVIPERCFLGCSGFNKLALTPNVTEIGPYAFNGCTGLTRVDYDGFRSQWRNVSVGGGNTPLVNASFYWLYRYGKVSDTDIYWRINGSDGKLLIYGTGNMKDYPEYPENAPWYQYWPYIETIEVQSGVTKIGVNAFRMTKALTTVYLPDSINTIGQGAFNESNALTDVWYDGSNVKWWNVTVEPNNVYLARATLHTTGIGGMVYSDEGSIDLSWSLNEAGVLRVYWDEETMDMSEMAIPDYRDERETPWYKYGNGNGQIYPMINAIVVDEYVTRIGENSFAGIPATEVSISSTVTSIGDGAFNGCNELISVVIPDTVESMEDNVFWGCTSLETATLPDGITEIPYGTFYGCRSLEIVRIPGSVTSIGSNAFSGCSNLDGGYVYFDGTSAQWSAMNKGTGNDILNSATIFFNPPEIAVNADNFPDPVFRAYVSENFDTDHSGWLSIDERLAVERIECTEMGIASLTGIEHFPNLEFLDCSNNEITVLDLSENVVLVNILCNNNPLTGLDLSSNPMLTAVDCENCGLTELDLSENTALWWLRCDDNPLTELDLGNNHGLGILYINMTGIESLTLGDMPLLYRIRAEGTNFSELDVRGCPKVVSTVWEGICNKYDTNWFYSGGPDDGYIVTPSNVLLITSDYIVTGVTATGDGVVYSDANEAYMMSSAHADFTWKDDTVPDSTLYYGRQTPIYTNADLEGEYLVEEPMLGVDYYFGIGVTNTVEHDHNIDISDIDSTVPRTLTLTGYTTEYVKTVKTVSSGADRLYFVFKITKDIPEGTIHIDAYHFPDQNFRTYVAENLDPNNDGYLTDAELAAVESIDCPDMEIASLAGVELFPNLKYLDCGYNDLTSLNLNGNPLLEELYCFENDLTGLNLSGKTNLRILECQGNPRMGSLDLSDSPAMTYLDCSSCFLRSLILGDKPVLSELNCGSNAYLTELDLSGTGNLWYLDCRENALTSLDLSGNPNLLFVDCEDNNLTSLTLGSLPLIRELWARDNDFIRLDIQGCPKLLTTVLQGTLDTSDGDQYYSGGPDGGYLVVDLDVNVITAPEGIPIDEEHFPDPIFRAYVAENFDPDHNGYLTDAECEAVKKIEVSGSDIASLEGIRYFSELESLEAYSTELRELDLHENTNLKGVYVHYNSELTSINLSGLTLLTYLELEYNRLTELDLSTNTKLRSLDCGGNLLTNLDVSTCVALTSLSCYENSLTSLNVSMLPILNYLYCNDNSLSTLDLRNNYVLEELDCSGNDLNSIDLSANTQLRGLWCTYNNFTQLDVTMLPELRVLECYHTPLESLKLGSNGNLSRLACYETPDTFVLDISGCPLIIDTYQNGTRTVTDIPDFLTFATYMKDNHVLEIDVDQTVVTEVVVPRFRTKSLVLSGQIGVNFFMQLPQIDGVDYSTSYMTFSITGNGTTTPRDDIDPDDMNTSGTYYGFTCYVNSLQMADTITAVFHYTQNGEEKTVELEYSVKEYLTTVENNASLFNEKTLTLIRSIADYGHYAQAFLAEANDLVIGTDYAAMDKFYTTEFDYEAVKAAVNDKGIVKNLGDSDIEKVTYNLYLNSDTVLEIHLQPKNNAEVTAKAVFNGKTYIARKSSSGRYTIVIEGISAHLLGQMINITGTAGSDFTVQISVLSYVKAVLNNDSFSPNAKNAMCALYKYYDAVMKYRAG